MPARCSTTSTPTAGPRTRRTRRSSAWNASTRSPRTSSRPNWPLPATADVRWVQEEPANQRAWSFLAPRLHRLARRPVDRVSRPEAPAPAVGSARRHALSSRLS
ncbi:hypothetical protein [Streptomyces sp. 5112.2]|uniref:hypothetical protein n=1 Tax=Streptomyces sp. 5112.2 TaxID=1938848 RepID=UPI0027D889DB|nr:hypothetical protein [Streptomyces sp. 5112.2]